MAGTLFSRSADTVTSDLKEMVNNWIRLSDDRVELIPSEEYNLLVEVSIELQGENPMLTREQAILVSSKLSEMALNDMRKTISRPNTVLHDVDCMSLYADIYCMYLRPGTYSI